MKKIDKEVMKVVYNACVTSQREEDLTQEKTAIINQYEFLRRLPYKYSIDEQILDEKIALLAIKDYYECQVVYYKGLKQYKFTLLNKGKSFVSQIENEKRMVRVKIILTISGPILGYIIGKIIQVIVKSVGH